MAEKKVIKYLNDILDTTTEIENNNKKINNTNILFAYRGEPKNFNETKLMPSLFRNTDYVLKEKYLFELLGDYNIIDSGKERYIEKAIEAQHYVAISRALDISFSILPALYFACNKDFDEDGVLYVFGFPRHFSPHSTYIEEVYKSILEGSTIIYDKNFRVITHSRYNERISAQSGGFIFFPGRKFCPLNPLYYKEIIIEAGDKRDILRELQDFFDIHEEKLFPGKGNAASTVKKIFTGTNIYDKHNIVSIENEIDFFFERVDYELEMMRVTDEIEDMSLSRIVRKEKEDLLFFLKQREEEEKDILDEKELTENIEKRFQDLVHKVEERFEILRRSK